MVSGLRSSRLTKYILLAVVLLAVAAIVSLQGQLAGERLQTQSLSSEVQRLEQENLELESNIADLGSDEAVIRLARERLHWVFDDEVVYVDAGE